MHIFQGNGLADYEAHASNLYHVLPFLLMAHPHEYNH